MTVTDADAALTSSPAFATYKNELALWLAGAVEDEEGLVPAGAALCVVARDLKIQPESLLVAIRGGRPAPVFQEGSDREARESQARAHRYTLAVNLLLECYFE